MLPPSLVIFDCDGVLVDSERLSHSVLKQMLAEFGTELTLQETLDHFMGTSTEKCLAVLEALIKQRPPPDFLATFRDRTYHEFRASLSPVLGADEVVAALKIPFCVASNGPREKMRFTLGHTGLLQYFEGRLFSAEDVARPKPAPDLFLHAAREMETDPANCIVVEDSPTGVAAAKSAGMRVFGYAAMGQKSKLRDAGADLVFHNMAELPRLMHSRPGDA